MMRDQHQEHAAIVDEMRRLARSGLAASQESEQWQNLAAAERAARQDAILEALGEHVDLRSIMERAHHPADGERTGQVADGLARLEEEASRLANEELAQFLRIRGHYRDAFGEHPEVGGRRQLKFRDVLYTQGDTTQGTCTYFGHGIFSPWIGPDSDVTADIASSTTPQGTWLYPRIVIRTNSCDDTREGRTFQDVTYRMDAPSASFGVEHVRVDLIASGISSAKLGDTGWFSKPSKLYDHSYVTLDTYIGQEIDGEWNVWPLVSDTLLVRHGEGAVQVRSALSGQTYSHNFFLRGADTGGGELLCFVQVSCSALPIGSDAMVRLDFGEGDGHGIFVGGVALIGAYA